MKKCIFAALAAVCMTIGTSASAQQQTAQPQHRHPRHHRHGCVVIVGGENEQAVRECCREMSLDKKQTDRVCRESRRIARKHRKFADSYRRSCAHVRRILTPEQRAARDLTSEMGLGSKVQTLALDSDHYVLKFRAPEALVGLKYADVDLNGSYHLTLVAVARPVKSKNLLGIDRREYRAIDAIDPDDKITADDLLVCYGTKKAYFSLFETTSPI